MKRVESVLASLDSSRRRLLAEVEGVLEPRFSARPPGGGWSVGQVIEHLARTDEALARGIVAACAGKLRTERRPGDILGRLAFRSQVYKLVAVRTGASFDPESAPERGAAMARLAETREALVSAIDAGERRGVWSQSIRHPFFGPLPMLEMIDFMAYHEERHRRQIVRIKRALDTAGG